jgi:hypothetical protein
MTPHAVTCALGIYDHIYDQMYLEDGDSKIFILDKRGSLARYAI